MDLRDLDVTSPAEQEVEVYTSEVADAEPVDEASVESQVAPGDIVAIFVLGMSAIEFTRGAFELARQSPSATTSIFLGFCALVTAGVCAGVTHGIKAMKARLNSDS